jgi:hypothetical protein
MAAREQVLLAVTREHLGRLDIAEHLLGRHCAEIDMGGVTLRLVYVDGVEAQIRKSLT